MTFECIENCGECCGIVVFDKNEFEKIKQFIPAEIKIEQVAEEDNKIAIITADRFCCFLDRETKKCLVHDHRPQVCKDYGIEEGMPCPYVKKSGKRRSEAKTEKMKRIIENRNKDNPLKKK